MIQLTDDMRQRLANALADGCPVIAASVEFTKEPSEEFWGWWAQFKDSEGNEFGLGQS